MKLAIVQLGDIQSRRRATRYCIVLAVKNVAPTADTYLLAVTGDVAFCGTKGRYELAAQFFLSIRDELGENGKAVLQFCVPGNHDLDFTVQPDTRDALL